MSMPGMMNTILNLGINDDIAAGLAQRTGNPRFAYDCYRRFIQMFADVVLGADAHAMEQVIEDYKKQHGYANDVAMQAEDWQAVIERFKAMVDFPEDPFVQLRLAVEAVFQSWHTPRANVYREMNNIPDTLGTAVNVQAMVFGNFGEDSGSGVAFTRNPATGEREFFGEFLFNAAGEDVVAGIRTPEPVNALAERLPEVYDELDRTQALLEKALPRHAGHRIHGTGRPLLHAADAQRQAHGPCGGAHRRGDGRRGHDRTSRKRCCGFAGARAVLPAPDGRPGGRARGRRHGAAREPRRRDGHRRVQRR
jgi:phosphoenolpyruvate synthase/pyruvate phosphate dikinase